MNSEFYFLRFRTETIYCLFVKVLYIHQSTVQYSNLLPTSPVLYSIPIKVLYTYQGTDLFSKYRKLCSRYCTLLQLLLLQVLLHSARRIEHSLCRLLLGSVNELIVQNVPCPDFVLHTSVVNGTDFGGSVYQKVRNVITSVTFTAINNITDFDNREATTYSSAISIRVT